jgi:TatD DNase family protein
MVESRGADRLLIDTHAHINGPEFDDDLSDVLKRAIENGVGRIVCVGYDIPTSERAIALAEQNPALFATVGLHPNSVWEAPADWEQTLRRLAAHPRVVAIGETGLDYYRDYTPRALQQPALRWHLDLANELDLPVIIHNRDANVDTTAELRAWASARSSSRRPGVLHSFAGDEAMMRTCVDAGFAISFSGMVTFSTKSLAYLSDVAKRVPDDALLVETDSPYLAPVPFRGRRNEPSFVRSVAARLAELRGSSPEAIEAATTRNACSFFPRLGASVDG